MSTIHRQHKLDKCCNGKKREGKKMLLTHADVNDCVKFTY